MAVIVTGGCGFVGSWVVRKLLQQGRDVVILDPGRPNEIFARVEKGSWELLSANVLDYAALLGTVTRIRDTEGVEGVIHMAASIATRFLEAPRENCALNIMGSLNMLEVCRSCKIDNFVFTSSGGVYGNVEGILSEELPPAPTDLYGATKVAVELLGEQYAASFNMDFKAVRLYFIYGPGLRPSQAFPPYKTAFGALEGLTDLDLPAGDDQLFDFNYIEDAVQGIICALGTQRPLHRIFNIGSGKAFRLREILAVVKKHVAGLGPVRIGPGKIMKRGAPLRIERARKEIGYSPVHDLDRGIARFHAWLKRGEL